MTDCFDVASHQNPVERVSHLAKQVSVLERRCGITLEGFAAIFASALNYFFSALAL
jgi:hypothetical protein